METKISIIYANRNKDVERVKVTLNSLERQKSNNFEVIFVDYGSDPRLVQKIRKVVKNYRFVRFFPLEVSQMLWNKSKALNFGMKQATSQYIFIADVDLVFHPNTTAGFEELATSENFFLFRMGYLNKAASNKLSGNYNFQNVNPHRYGNVNGMILAPREAFLAVNGLDEFFHFYGSEDEDLFARLENAGYKRKFIGETYFLHNWHQSFAGSKDTILTGNPGVKNIMRINQRHFVQNREKGVIKPLRQEGMGNMVPKDKRGLLKAPTKTYRISNILAHVEHFLNEELPGAKGEVVQAEFVEDPYYHTLKHKLKKIIGKQTQPYCSLKEVNDMLLKKIVFEYRDVNYSFSVSGDRKSMIFCVAL